MITELKDNQIFCFGSNGQGIHGGGAAKFAYDKGWTHTGHAHGLSWQSFAIDTMDGLEVFKNDLGHLAVTARHNPSLTFYLTAVGTGIANYSKQEVMDIMPEMPDNVIFVDNWNNEV